MSRLWWRRRRTTGGDAGAPLHRSVAIGVGVLAGFVTLIANAAGPLMAIYLLAMRVPKIANLVLALSAVAGLLLVW